MRLGNIRSNEDSIYHIADTDAILNPSITTTQITTLPPTPKTCTQDEYCVHSIVPRERQQNTGIIEDKSKNQEHQEEKNTKDN